MSGGIDNDLDNLYSMHSHIEPIFVVGSLRSGASILYACLSQHPDITPILESGWLLHMASTLQHTFAEGIRTRATAQLDIAGIEIEDFYAHFGEAANALILQTLHGDVSDATRSLVSPHTAANPSAVRWLDASPDACFHIIGLQRLFPNAKFIHVLRDARSVVRSLTDESLRNVYRSQYRQFTEEAAFDHWIKAVEACVEAEQALGSDTVLRIRREDLVNSAQSVMGTCLDFLGLPFSSACLRPLT